MLAVGLTAVVAGCGGDDDGNECGPGTVEVDGICQVVGDGDADADADSDSDADADCTEPDEDGDGHASVSCDGDDCNDTEIVVHPGAPDPLGDCADANCDGIDSADDDLDGHPSLPCGGDDCDDHAGDVYPGAPDEWGDGIDLDCDRKDGVDADGDEFPSEAFGGNDCNDDDPDVHPNLFDQEGDGEDMNCDGVDGYGPEGNPLASGGCNWTRGDQAVPQFRITALDILAPTVLADREMQGIVTAALDAGGLVWLLDLADGDFRTGDGTCVLLDLGDLVAQADCRFEGELTAKGTADYDADTGALRVPSGTGTLDVTVVIHSQEAGDIPLALHEGLIEGIVAHDGNCIGERLNDYEPSEWDTAGNNVEAKITVDEAEAVDLAGFGQTLCDLLSEMGAGWCAANPDPAAWPADAQRPDTALGDGTPGWTVRATFAAIGVEIAP